MHIKLINYNFNYWKIYLFLRLFTLNKNLKVKKYIIINFILLDLAALLIIPLPVNFHFKLLLFRQFNPRAIPAIAKSLC